MARPLSPTGDNFGIGITGQNFDPTHLADPAKAVEFIKAETGRVDLELASLRGSLISGMVNRSYTYLNDNHYTSQAKHTDGQQNSRGRRFCCGW